MGDQVGPPVEEPEPKHESPVIDQQPKSVNNDQPENPQTLSQHHQVQPAPVEFVQPEFQKPLPENMKQFRQPVNDGTAATKVPRGLEPLATAKQVVVKHDSEVIETKCKCYQNCHYEIYNEKQQVIYYAAEDINLFSLCCLTKFRPYRMRIYDQLQYNCALYRGTINFILQQSTIEVPPKEIKCTIKKVKGEQSGKPYFDVSNSQGELVFKIKPISDEEGPVGKFDIFGPDQQTKIGELSNRWSGFFRDSITPGKDSFGLSIPIDLEVGWKAALLGCLFFIDYLIYESK